MLALDVVHLALGVEGDGDVGAQLLQIALLVVESLLVLEENMHSRDALEQLGEDPLDAVVADGADGGVEVAAQGVTLLDLE
jgi:hypothetical protein